jgi:urease subunit gamma/beta
VHLTPHEQERLLIYVAAEVARKRKASTNPKIPLNYPEAVALITAYVLEEARAGQKTVAQLMGSVPRSVLDYPDLMPGVAEMLSGIQIEATFPDGTKMVSIRHPLTPITTQSTPPTGSRAGTQPTSPAPQVPWVHPGEIEHPVGAAPVVFNRHIAQPKIVTVTNDDDRAVQVGSHYHFYEVNPLLTITPDRRAAYGMRLNIPAGSTMRFEPKVTVDDVQLVPIEGYRIVEGLRGDVGGRLP